jgi:cytochrome c553
VRLAVLAAISLTSSAADVGITGSAKRGATIAQACLSCHGAHGEGSPAAGNPRLAGQSASYLLKQLRDYVSGSRSNSVMSAIAKAYNDQQQVDVATYYASLTKPYNATVALSDKRLIERGRLLARAGDESKQVQACANCHGPDGSGEAPVAPYLAGQSGNYLVSAINEWKSGARRNDGGGQMAVVAFRLDDGDLAALAAYFESLGQGTL